MNVRLWMIPMFLFSFFSISATSVKVQPNPVEVTKAIITENPSVGKAVRKSQHNFVERLLLKYVIKKFKKAGDNAKADKQASTSLSFGIAAMGVLLIGLIVPYVILATIPLGIVAMTTGSSALKDGTTETARARTGKTLGLAALITFGVLLIVGLILVAAFLGSWGG